MKALVIGGGAREHAIVDALITGGAEVYCYMPLLNPGIMKAVKKYCLGKFECKRAVEFAKTNNIDLAVIGPETPLEMGSVDALENEGIPCVGPTKEQAQLETSKGFTRMLLQKYDIDASPKFRIFTKENAGKVNDFLYEVGGFVVKPDGLTGGKGVRVSGEHINSRKEATEYCIEVLETHPSAIIEEKLEGEEFSLQTLTDGKAFLHFPPVQDHKRAFDGDSGPNCYSSDTEILTKRGWLSFNKLKQTDKVATYSQKRGVFWFEKPTEIHWMAYKGKMVNFKNREVDLLVTPNHRMLLEQRKGFKRQFVVEARNYKGENYIYRTARYAFADKKVNPEYFVLPSHDYKFNRKLKSVKIRFQDWVGFLGLYLSEGYVSKKENMVLICQTSKSKHFKTMKRILSKLPFALTYEPKNNKFRINSIQLVKYLEQFGTSHNKFVPDYVKNSSEKTIIEFLKAYLIGDGDLHRGRMRFSSSSKRIIDDLQELFLRLGKSGMVTVDKRETMVSPINRKTYAAAPVYAIETGTKTKTNIRKTHVSLHNYKGHVGCVTVSSGFVIVRRNNRIAISGNTGGMGSYSDANLLLPFISKEDLDAARQITEQVADAIKKELGTAYKGVMYGGFIKTAAGIKLIEYNARFGDPETMNVLPILKTSFADICEATVQERLGELKAEFERKATVCKYVVPKGYPDAPETGRIKVPEKSEALIYYAAVEEKNGGIYTTKSRGVAMVGIADTIEEAERIAEDAASKVEGAVYHRKDIGTAALIQKRVEHIKHIMG